MNALHHWHVIYTRPGYEQKVAEVLTKKGIQNYCPLHTAIKVGQNRKKEAEVPLFHSYVFVRVDATQYAAIKKINGVLNFVYWLQKPVVVQEQEISSIQTFLNDYKQVQLIKAEVIPGKEAKLLKEPLADSISQVTDHQQEVFQLTLPSLGYILAGHAEKSKVGVIKAANQKVRVPQLAFNNYRLSLD